MNINRTSLESFCSDRLPTLGIIIAAALVFILQHNVSGFLGPGFHGYLSSHGMAITANISPKKPLFMYEEMALSPDGSVQYTPYNRFPIGSFALLKLFTRLFPHSLGMQITVAYAVMNSFFILAFWFAYLSIIKLTENKLVAVTATLTAFSSYFCLYYKDMIFNDIPTIFGLMLTFHGMVIFVQEHKFKQLVVKSLCSLLLGWQVYALLGPFILFGCIRNAYVSKSVKGLFHTPFFTLGIFSVLLGIFVLSVNFLVEYFALNLPLDQLPTYRSMMWRFGLGVAESYKEYEPNLNWSAFIFDQFSRIGRMSIPAILRRELGNLGGNSFFGIAVVLMTAALIWISRERLLFASLALSGLCWALPMRAFVAFHDFQSIYYIGIPVVFYSLVLLLLQRKSNYLILASFAIVFCMWTSSLISANADKLRYADSSILTTDFQKIADIVKKGRKIYVVNKEKISIAARHAVEFYLAGNYLQPNGDNVDFIISDQKHAGESLLTPDNVYVFLYKTDNKATAPR